VFGWDPAYLDLLGLDGTGAVPLMSSAFPANDAWGLNEVVPPHDGDGLYLALALIGDPVEVTTNGVLLTTFQFAALQPTTGTFVDMLTEGGSPPINTAVIDGLVPGLEVTGTLTGAMVTIVPEPKSVVLLALVGLTLVLMRHR
jgi:hypothetical protein